MPKKSSPTSPHGHVLSSEQAYGQALVQVDLIEKAVNEVDAKQNATEKLVQVLFTQMQELRADNQALRSRVEELERRPRNAGGGGTRPATFDELEERVMALKEIRARGKSCGMARAAGYTCAEAREAGYPLLEAKAAGWASDKLRMAGYISSKGMSSREFFDRYQAGCTNFSGLDFSGEDFSRMVLDKQCQMRGCNFSNATFDHATLGRIDFTDSDMSNVDMSYVQIKDYGTQMVNCKLVAATFDHAHLSYVNFTDSDMSNASMSHAQLHFVGMSASTKVSKPKWTAVKCVGGATTFQSMKQVGFTFDECASMQGWNAECKDSWQRW